MSSSDWSDKADRNSREWLFSCNKWRCKITYLPYSRYKKHSLQVNNGYRQSKSTALIFCLQHTEKTFQIRPPESDILTFSSSLPQFSPEVILAPQFRADSLTWLLRDFSVSAHFPPVTLFLPLDSKNKGKKLSPYHPPPCKFESGQIIPGSGIEHYFKDSPATCPIPSSFFHF